MAMDEDDVFEFQRDSCLLNVEAGDRSLHISRVDDSFERSEIIASERIQSELRHFPILHTKDLVEGLMLHYHGDIQYILKLITSYCNDIQQEEWVKVMNDEVGVLK